MNFTTNRDYKRGPDYARRAAIIRRLWPLGDSAIAIAREIGGGVTKNAVIGMVRRLGLPQRGSPIIMLSPEERERRVREKLEQQARARVRQHNTAQAPAAPRTPRAIMPADTPDMLRTPDPARGCKWICTDNKPWLYCGLPTRGGSWCPHHHGIVFHRKPVPEEAA